VAIVTMKFVVVTC